MGKSTIRNNKSKSKYVDLVDDDDDDDDHYQTSDNNHRYNKQIEQIYKQQKYIKALPCIEVDMDLPPMQRWQNLKADRVNEENLYKLVYHTRKHIDEKIGFSFTLSNDSTIQLVRYFFFLIVRFIGWLWFAYYDDLYAFSVLMKVDPAELVIANCIYEFSIACTSFIVYDELTNRPIHGRSLDWPFQQLAKYAVHFKFTRTNPASTGRYSYHAVGWPGLTGFMTAVNPGVCSVSLNARFSSLPVINEVPEWFSKCYQKISPNDCSEDVLIFSYHVFKAMITKVKSVLTGGWTTAHAIRYAFEQSKSYEEMKMTLESIQLITPSYFIIAGPSHEGCIITRDVSSASVRSLGDENTPYLIQTNDDYDKISKMNTGEISDAPEGFDSINRYNITNDRLAQSNGKMKIAEAASLICTSFKQGGVRMQITLYMCVMNPSDMENPIFACRATRGIGGFGLQTKL